MHGHTNIKCNIYCSFTNKCTFY